jgi:hypothetical protein
MNNPMPAWTVVGLGVLLVLVSLFADPFGLGRSSGFGWKQILGVVVGALIIAAGFYLRRRPKAVP